MIDDDCIPPRDTSPHQNSTGKPPAAHRRAGTATPTTADTEDTAPQCANPTHMFWLSLSVSDEAVWCQCRSVTKLRLAWYEGVFLLLQQRSKVRLTPWAL